MQSNIKFLSSRVDWVLVFIGVALLAGLCAPRMLFAADPCETAEQLYNNGNLPDDVAERLDVLTTIVGLCPTFIARYEQGVAYLELGKPDLALISFNAAKGQLGDADSNLLGNLNGRYAQTYHELGNRPKAVAHVDYANDLLGDNIPEWLIELTMQIHESATRSIWKAGEIQNTLDTKGSFFVSSGQSSNQTSGSQNSDRVSSSHGQTLAVQILFETNSARLNGSGARQAQEIGNALGKYINNGKSVQIVGHTDIRGDQLYNQRLSEQRALSVVRQILNAHPTYRSNLRAFGKGEAQPRYAGNTERAHQLNRRVEIRLVSN